MSEPNTFVHDALTNEEMDRLATLARLYLTPKERDALLKDMESILRHVDALGSVQHEAVGLYSTGRQGPKDLRPDEVEPSLPVDAALGAAPQRLGDGFGVPKVIG